MITIPIPFVGNKRRMRTGKRCQMEPWSGVRPTPGQIIDRLHRAMRNLFVKVFLQGPSRWTGFNHAIHSSGRGHKGWTRLPICHPIVFRWINICHCALVKTMQLIRADKVHFSRQHSMIPQVPHVMCQRRLPGWQFTGIVPNLNFGRKPARHHRGPRRNAQWIVAIRVIKHHAIGSKSVKVWRFTNWIAIK